jgi:hypothetical protein
VQQSLHQPSKRRSKRPIPWFLQSFSPSKVRDSSPAGSRQLDSGDTSVVVYYTGIPPQVVEKLGDRAGKEARNLSASCSLSFLPSVLPAIARRLHTPGLVLRVCLPRYKYIHSAALESRAASRVSCNDTRQTPVVTWVMAMEKKSWNARDVVAGAFSIEVVDEEEDTVPAIPPPQTPLEPMEYLSRSWSVSASEISKILVGGSKKSSVAAASRLPEMGTAIPEDPVLPAASIVPLTFHHQHVRNPRHTASFFALHFFFVTISFRLIHGADEKNRCRGMQEGIP